MANVADTKLYDILGVPPGASENELKKVVGSGTGQAGCGGRGPAWLGLARPRYGAAHEPAPDAAGPGWGAVAARPASADLGLSAPPARKCSK